MSDAVLVVNAGSSSVKFALYRAQGAEPGAVMLQGQVEGIGATPQLSIAHGAMPGVATALPEQLTHDEAVPWVLDWIGQRGLGVRIVAAGHRVVHGGRDYAGPVLVDDTVIDDLRALIPLARLHEPYELAGILGVAQRYPGLPQVACFDTAFHRGMPFAEQTFALPREFAEAGVRRYGFHGLSYEYIASALPALMGARADGRVVVAHLGSGSSLCAMRRRRSVATTMGFTALDGLAMGTRCGALDPGVVLYLIQERGMSPMEVNDLLYKRSGLLGLSGVSADMRTLLASPDPRAAEAVAVYVHRVVREIGAMAACIGGLDALVFTGGIGEHAGLVREQVCGALEWLGIDFDTDRNQAGGPRISRDASPCSAWVIATDEERVMARHTLATLAGTANR